MKDTGFRTAMTWLHTWSGLLLGWILFAIFLTGTASYFRPEITAWMQPEAPRHVSALEAGRHALAHLEKTAPDATLWGAELPDNRSDALRVFWRNAPPARFQSAKLDPLTGGKDTARATNGGEFFYRFHFQLMLPHPWGRWLACIAAMFMLVALVSGVATHRRLLQDMFLFRRTKDGRRPWLDFHNVTAVVALPFYFLISYSALVIFAPMYMPWANKILGPAEKPAVVAPASSVTSAAVPTLDEMFRTTASIWGESRSVRRIDVTARGTPAAAVTFTRVDGPAVSLNDRETLKFSIATGALLDDVKKTGPAESINSWLYGFHLARFASPGLRTLFFIMGLLGAAMCGTGLALWTLKRRERLTTSGRGGRFGYGLVSRLNITFITGLTVACASFFWANRLIPAVLADRNKWEVNVVLIVWAIAALHACVRPERAAWREQLYAGAFAFGALPLLDLLTGGRADTLYLGFTVAFLSLTVLFAYGARKLSGPAPSRA